MKRYQWVLSGLLAWELGRLVTLIATAESDRYLKVGINQYYEQPVTVACALEKIR